MIIEVHDEVVALSGALRRNHFTALESAVNLRLRAHPEGIVLDCGGITAITPQGAETIRDVAAHLSAEYGGARLVLAAVPAHVLRVLRHVPNLGSQTPIAETVADARRSLGLSAPAAPGLSARAAAIAEGRGEVLVGLFGSSSDPHAVAVGCRIAAKAARIADGGRDGSGAAPSARPRVHLIYLLTVPRDRPLLAAVGEEDGAAAELARLAEAVRAAGHVPVTRLERTRSAASRLVALTGDLRAGVVVLALSGDAAAEEVATVEAVIAQARCDVLVDRLRSAESGTGPLPAAGGMGLGRRAVGGGVPAGSAALLRRTPMFRRSSP
jgi:hypothetical protein